MTSESNLTVEARLLQLLQHLGIERAHFAASAVEDIGQLLRDRPEAVASLSLVAPRPVARTIGVLRNRALVVYGSEGPSAAGQARILDELPHTQASVLQGYAHQIWSDVLTERGPDVLDALSEFLARQELPAPSKPR